MGFYSRNFTVPKRDGGLQPIMDLQDLNRSVAYKCFRMTALQSILILLQQEMWMATLALQDAYFHITIIPPHWKYLHFTVGDDHFQFKALLFKISSAPWVFTKTMVVVIAHLRSQGIHIYPYLDDWLLTAGY